MIFLIRPAAPAYILARSAAKRLELIDLYNLYAADYNAGTRIFTFDHNTYGHTTVKEKLAFDAQNGGKCCFCESKVLDYGDVEHFRPKGGYMQMDGEPLQRPGYYWLAYEWDNLMFSCQRCNEAYKKNYFPLFDTARRALNHTHDIADEEPIMINPFEEDPEGFIEYIGTTPKAIDGNPRGKETIKRTGIDDPERKVFFEVRRDHYMNMKALYNALWELDNDNPTRNDIEILLLNAMSEKAQFSLMIKCAVRDGFVY